jgi:hypothetical protein
MKYGDKERKKRTRMEIKRQVVIVIAPVAVPEASLKISVAC